MQLYKMKLKAEPPFMICLWCLDEIFSIYHSQEIEYISSEPTQEADRCPHCHREDKS